MHKGAPIRALLTRYAGRLTLERLPACAPRLNPVEPLWSWLKYGRLPNFAQHDAHELDAKITGELRSIQRSQRTLRNLFMSRNCHCRAPYLPERLERKQAKLSAPKSVACSNGRSPKTGNTAAGDGTRGGLRSLDKRA